MKRTNTSSRFKPSGETDECMPWVIWIGGMGLVALLGPIGVAALIIGFAIYSYLHSRFTDPNK